MDFETALQDKTSPIAIDFDPKREVLLLAFGGLAHQLGFPMFEFNKVTRGLDGVNKIYLRDHFQLWYHRGLPNLANSMEGIAKYLRKYTGHPSTKRTVVFGNSGGAYAALLFGHLLQADEVHAFSPKSVISPHMRMKYKDKLPIGSETRSFLRLLFYGRWKYFDIRSVLLNSPPQKTIFHVYYSTQHQIDKVHAERLSSIPRMQLHPYAYGDHNLIVLLRDSGELSKIIERSILLGE